MTAMSWQVRTRIWRVKFQGPIPRIFPSGTQAALRLRILRNAWQRGLRCRLFPVLVPALPNHFGPVPFEANEIRRVTPRLSLLS